MLDVFIEAFGNIASLQNMMFLCAGVTLGLVVGVLPGFGGAVGLALLLPFIYGMDPAAGLSLLIGVMSVVCTSDTFPAVLIGVPGSVSSQATVMDGFPLAKKGQAARALSAAFAASMIGGVFGAFVLSCAIVIARPLVLAFGTGEMLMLGLLGLTMVGVLTGNSVLKGLLSALVGVMLGMVGIAPATNEYRLEFEILYFSNGIPLLIIALAIFAVPEIVDLLRKDSAISKRALLGHGWIQGLKDAIRHRWLILRCSGLGCLIGILPGLGGSVVDWIAYAHAMHSAKDSSQFGKGDIRGVVAPESSNNAKEGGALIPTLIFGIPGSSGTAILLGGMILLGVEPGITMVTQDLPLIYTIIWSLAVANVIGALACIFLAGPIARLTAINFNYLAPFMIMLIMFAAYQSSRAWGDMVMLTIIGILAIYMRRFGFSRPAMMVGFVLANGIESNLYLTINYYGWEVFTRPLFLGLTACAIFTGWIGYKMIRKQKATQDIPAAPLTNGQVIFPLLLAGAGLFVIVFTWDMLPLARVMPVMAAGVTIVAVAALLWQMISRRTDPQNRTLYDEEAMLVFSDSFSSTAFSQILWFVGLMVSTWLIGFYISIGLFIFVFLKTRSPASLWKVTFLTACGLAVLAFISHMLVLEFPRGLLQEAIELPWPLA